MYDSHEPLETHSISQFIVMSHDPSWSFIRKIAPQKILEPTDIANTEASNHLVTWFSSSFFFFFSIPKQRHRPLPRGIGQFAAPQRCIDAALEAPATAQRWRPLQAAAAGVQNGAGADGVFLQKGHPGDQQWAMSRPPGCFMWDTLIYIYIVYI